MFPNTRSQTTPLFRAQGYVVESPPPVSPEQNFHHEPKVDNNEWDSFDNVLAQGHLEHQKSEVGLSEVEKKGLVSLYIFCHFL